MRGVLMGLRGLLVTLFTGGVAGCFLARYDVAGSEELYGYGILLLLGVTGLATVADEAGKLASAR